MAFLKLDCGILDSTIWHDLPAREVFLTALLMCEPIEIREDTRTFQTDSLEELGFAIPPGWYGMTQSSGLGIVRRSGLSDAEGMAALKRLSEPDPGSRSTAFDGRRLVRVDGGYVALNYDIYRLKDYGNAERCKRWREHRKNISKLEKVEQREFDKTRKTEARIRGSTRALKEGLKIQNKVMEELS